MVKKIQQMIADAEKELANLNAADRTAEVNEKVAAYREQVIAEFEAEKVAKIAELTTEIEVLNRVAAKLQVEADVEADTEQPEKVEQVLEEVEATEQVAEKETEAVIDTVAPVE